MHRDAGEVHRKRADDASDLAGYRATGVNPPEEIFCKGRAESGGCRRREKARRDFVGGRPRRTKLGGARCGIRLEVTRK
jgi:hypothetical protein